MIYLWPYNNLLINCLMCTSLIGAAMGAVGAFTFLRRESLLGDVLAHSALPGIMIAILLYQTITPLIILLGGAANAFYDVTKIQEFIDWLTGLLGQPKGK